MTGIYSEWLMRDELQVRRWAKNSGEQNEVISVQYVQYEHFFNLPCTELAVAN